jgi:hypothetical protein
MILGQVAVIPTQMVTLLMESGYSSTAMVVGGIRAVPTSCKTSEFFKKSLLSMN